MFIYVLLFYSEQENYDEDFPDISLAIEYSLRDDNQTRYCIIIVHFAVVGSLTFLNHQILTLVSTHFMESVKIF